MKLFLILIVALILIGCESKPVKSTQDSTATHHSSQKVKKGAVNYQQIIHTSRLDKLIEIEQYGIYEAVDEAGYIDSIRLRIKMLGIDEKAGRKIADEEELLDPLLHGVTVLLSEKTAVDQQNIELIMQLGACQAHALAGSLKDIKCNKAPIKLTGADDSSYIKTKYSIEQYNDCLKSGANHAFCLNYAATSRDRTVASGTLVLTENKLKQFCADELMKEFANHNFQPACEIVHNETERYFVIENIQVRSYLTEGYWEKFSVKLGYQYGKNADNEFYGDLKIEDGACIAQIVIRGERPRPDLFKDKLSDCDRKSDKKLIQKESALADLFNRYFEVKTKT